jgi:hypothetical protein
MMGELIQFEAGQRPWKPSQSAEPIETFLYNNMPIVGAFAQDWATYLFRCVEGVADETHVWAYTQVGPGALDELRNAKNLWDSLAEITAGGRFWTTLATDEDGIVAVFPPPSPAKSPGPVATILDTEGLVKSVLDGGFSRRYLLPRAQEDSVKVHKALQEKAQKALQDLSQMLSPT